ncbi:MAG: hypothetical protein ACK5ST_00560 [bacterium]|jgi:hypothetical protein
MKMHCLSLIIDEAFEIFGDKSEYVVAAPQYRAAANTAMGWKNSNLRTEMTRLLRRAGVSGWPRLFHSMRARRQTELQREFPLRPSRGTDPPEGRPPEGQPSRGTEHKANRSGP